MSERIAARAMAAMTIAADHTLARRISRLQTTVKVLALLLALSLIGLLLLIVAPWRPADPSNTASTTPSTATEVTTTTTLQAAQTTNPPAPPAATADDVVERYYSAVNAHQWAVAWQLGGRNFGQSYDSFINGYANTIRDVLSIDSAGDTGQQVPVHLLAYTDVGVIQLFSGVYTVQNGSIVSAQLAEQFSGP